MKKLTNSTVWISSFKKKNLKKIRKNKLQQLRKRKRLKENQGKNQVYYSKKGLLRRSPSKKRMRMKV